MRSHSTDGKMRSTRMRSAFIALLLGITAVLGFGQGCSSDSREPAAPEDPCSRPDNCLTSQIESVEATSQRDGSSIVTTAKVAGAEILELKWTPNGGGVRLAVTVLDSISPAPLQLAGVMPSLARANQIAATTILLNSPDGDTGLAGVILRQLQPQQNEGRNQAGCDVIGGHCGANGRCCDVHDECIDRNCRGPNDSGNVITCWRTGECSAGCQSCHDAVVSCYKNDDPGPSSCCERGNCGEEQQCIIDGQVVTDPCECARNGTPSADPCEDDEPPPCNSCGDVHIRTPDGLAYDFQGAGEYLLMSSSDGSVVVQGRQEPWGGSNHVTVNTAVAMNVAGDRVAVYLNRSPRLYINGAPATFGSTRIDLPKGGAVSYTSNGGYIIRWPNGFLVSASANGPFLDIGMSKPKCSTLTFAGLLGNMNDVASDDFFTRAGQSLGPQIKFDDLYDVFGASWQISQFESLFDYVPGTSVATYAKPDFPVVPLTTEDLDRDVYQAARDVCTAAGITDPIILNDCILDLALTGNSDFVKSGAGAPAPEGTVAVEYPDGLVGSYFDGYFADDLSFFTRNVPLVTRVDNPIAFSDDRASWRLDSIPQLADLETFSVIWRGRLIVPTSGTYTLYLNSDDASYLFLGSAADAPAVSNATINNGTAHPVRERHVDVQLQAGAHPIAIVYGEEKTNNIVQFSWSSAQLGIPKQIVTSLGRRADTTPPAIGSPRDHRSRGTSNRR